MQKTLQMKREQMYIKDNKQISLYDFGQKAGLTLDPNNRWVRMAGLIDWDMIEEQYSRLYNPDKGAPAKPIRLAIGAMLIKQIEGLPDEKLVLHIQENPYMQYFCGIKEFSLELPFVPSLMVEFRKRFSEEVIWNINEDIFRELALPDVTKRLDGGDQREGGDKGDPPNRGVLIPDATCTPANIRYPRDIDLCNDAREATEEIVEAMHAGEVGKKEKPRLDKRKAKKEYNKVAKSKKNNEKIFRKAIRKQLYYIRRNLGYITQQKEDGLGALLSDRQKKLLETIATFYEQQKYMLDHHTKSVPHRIVSLFQPHVRPIVRGKAAAKVEFGSKVSISVINGYVFLDNIGWEAYSEAGDLIEIIEYYRASHGCYPEAVMVDKIYRNRDNIQFCNKHGIRISGPRLGRPRKDEVCDKEQAYRDSGVRNIVESKIGIAKITYGLSRIMANLKETSETVIAIAILAMNLVKRLNSLCTDLLYSFRICYLLIF